MLEHARDLLRSVGYESPEGPFVEMGIGLDVGDAFVGNIGERAVYDFTAIGDVVNTASRLQGEAQGGEILLHADELREGCRNLWESPSSCTSRGRPTATTATACRSAIHRPSGAGLAGSAGSSTGA